MVAENDEDGTMSASLNCRVVLKLYDIFDSSTSIKRAHFDRNAYIHTHMHLYVNLAVRAVARTYFGR